MIDSADDAWGLMGSPNPARLSTLTAPTGMVDMATCPHVFRTTTAVGCSRALARQNAVWLNYRKMAEPALPLLCPVFELIAHAHSSQASARASVAVTHVGQEVEPQVHEPV